MSEPILGIISPANNSLPTPNLNKNRKTPNRVSLTQNQSLRSINPSAQIKSNKATLMTTVMTI